MPVMRPCAKPRRPVRATAELVLDGVVCLQTEDGRRVYMALEAFEQIQRAR